MLGSYKVSFTAISLLMSFFTIQSVKAQHVTVDSIKMEVKESKIDNQLLSNIIKIVNNSKDEFSGTLKFNSNTDIKLLSQNDRNVSIIPGDSSFFSFKLVVDNNTFAGLKDYKYSLLDMSGKEILVKDMNFEIEVREHINLNVDDTPLIILNSEDSVRVNVTVNNLGNLTEDVILVFNVPEIRNFPQFTEMKVSVEPMTRRTYTYSFIPSNNLLQKTQFSVHVTGMKGREKKLFGSRSITVQSVSSSRRFSDISSHQTVFPSLGSYDNALSLNYSQYSNSLYMMQLQGGGHYNLPAGYLQLKGNLYKYNSMETPVATNTSLMYKLHENEFTIGNLSERMELPLFGRGASMKFSDTKKNGTVTFGAIDQNYNLFGSQPWFKDYYSFYAKGEIGGDSYHNGTLASYLYQRNPYEGADYHVGSLQLNRSLGQSWNIDISVHGSMGKYDKIEDEKYTGAAEFRYSGSVSEKMLLNGSGYYSDPYFPGSRKGSTNFSQSISYRINNEISLNASVGYNKTEPKSYTHNYNYRSQNNNANLYMSLPKIMRLSSSIYYRFHEEESSVYLNGYEGETNALPTNMESNRIGWQWRWQRARSKHSLLGTLEGGVYTNKLIKGNNFQAKTSLNYSYDWLNMDISYQKGAYYLYENVMSVRADKDFFRFTASASVNKDISKNLKITSGFNFTRDLNQGNVPSVSLSANWVLKDNISLFANGYWYRYSYINNKNIFNSQVGLSYTFGKSQPISGKKSRVSARIYYDYNANDKYDEDDEPAEGYLIGINNEVFISDKEGKVKYSNVLFGEYSVNPLRAGRWFFNSKDFEVNSYRKTLNIPLKQSGTLQGNIRYVAGELSMDINERYEGLRFTITNEKRGFTRTVVTDGRGSFITFLPNGVYTIQLNKNTLPENTDCENYQQVFQIEAGKITGLDEFEIKIKERKINIKRF